MIIFHEETQGSYQKQVELENWQHPEKLWRMQVLSGFRMLGEEEKKQDFLYEPVPEIVLYSDHEQAWITMQVLSKGQEEKEIIRAGEAIQQLVERSYPQYKSTPVYYQDESGVPVAWFAMNMEERKAEHVKAVFFLQDRWGSLVLLTFTYPEEEKDKWRAILPILFSTIEEGKETTLLFRQYRK